jgi:hypothetical protein
MKKLLALPFILLTACSGYQESAFNCTGTLENSTTIIGFSKTDSTPKVIGIYITDSTKNLLNFWKEPTRTASVGGVLYLTNQFSIQDFAIIGNIPETQDSFGNQVTKSFVLDKKTNILTTNETEKRPGSEKSKRFEGACNSIKNPK